MEIHGHLQKRSFQNIKLELKLTYYNESSSSLSLILQALLSRCVEMEEV